MKKAPVNKIIPFSSVDGPGNRTAVFLQGCNFNCRYCHNPETRNLCCSCGDCVPGCPAGALQISRGKVIFDPARCCGCDACIQTCRYGCSPRIQYMTGKEVFQSIRRQLAYIRGVTVSGGECTLYPEFLKDFFTICKENGLETMIDSNGTLQFSCYPDLREVTDGVMLDIKAWSKKDHQLVTGASNEMVLENAVFLAKEGKLYEVRTVVVPELFDCRETVHRTAALLAPYLQIRDIRYKLITYRPMGVRKEYAHYKSPGKSDLEKLAACAREEGMNSVVLV